MEHHEQVEAKAVQHFRLSTIGFFVGLMLFFVGNWYLQSSMETRLMGSVTEPGAPVVLLDFAPVIENPLLCPGDSFDYKTTVTILTPSVVSTDSVIKNVDTGRTEVMSEPLRTIYNEEGSFELNSTYTLTLLLPATRILPQRQWSAGNYSRLLAFTGEEGEKRSSIVAMNFRIGDHCPNIVKRIGG